MSFEDTEALLYEIVELRDGEIALSRVDDHNEPLVTIRFSSEALYFLGQKKGKVAKAMIEAGLDAVAEMQEEMEEGELEELVETPVIH